MVQAVAEGVAYPVGFPLDLGKLGLYSLSCSVDLDIAYEGQPGQSGVGDGARN